VVVLEAVRVVLGVCLALLGASLLYAQSTPAAEITTLDLVVRDEARSRNIPVLIYLPVATAPAPVVLFSHGLGGDRTGSAYFGRHLATSGYVGVFLQHPGSDDRVWREVPALRRMAALRGAATPEQFLHRTADVRVVLDTLTTWQRAASHPLRGRLDMDRIAMSGHSFGAVSTQAVSGQFGAGQGRRLTDARIKAAIIMSPSLPATGTPEQAFGRVTIPWLLMTGTRDEAAIGDATVESRLGVFPALPTGGKYELVLFDGQHSAFTDRDLPGDRIERNPNHHRAISRISTAFLDAWLKKDAAARAWLDGDGPRTVLEPRDRWQKK
jgi:predicted dienelactone hydrolase